MLDFRYQTLEVEIFSLCKPQKINKSISLFNPSVTTYGSDSSLYTREPDNFIKT